MAYQVQMSAEDARARLQSGAVCLLLDAPEQLAFGIDQQVRIQAPSPAKVEQFGNFCSDM